jgi:phage terminase Nu1 subunit (DNA packaging protein)
MRKARKDSAGEAKPKRGARARLSTRRDVAQALGVHMDSISKWERQGLPIVKRGGRGRPSKYDLEAVRAWLAARDQAARKAADGPLDPVQERAARDHWQAELAEQTHQIRQKTLLPADEVSRAWAAEIAGVRAKLLALPTTFADRIHRAATLHGLAGVEKTLQAAVYDVLRQLAGATPREGAA